MNSFFTTSGRANRQAFLLRSLAIWSVCYGLAFMIGLMMGLVGGTEDQAGAVGGLLGAAFTVIYIFQAVQRLHDLDRSGWHYFLLLVPFYNVYLSILMVFQRGTLGANAYGNDPCTTAPAIP